MNSNYKFVGTVKDYPNYPKSYRQILNTYYGVRIFNRRGLVCAQCNYVGLLATRPFYLKHEEHLTSLSDEEKVIAVNKGYIFKINLYY